jgi:DNA-binding NarL/FixJ family response regulator
MPRYKYDGLVPVLTPVQQAIIERFDKPVKIIARELRTSPDSVKARIHSIFVKLDVSSREEALAKLKGLP